MHIILSMELENFLRDLLEMEEKLWQRRMKVLHQYQRIQEMKEKMRKIEEVFEQEVGIDMETAIRLLEEYENNPESFERLKDSVGEDIYHALQILADRIRDIRDMKAEIDRLEREVFEIDGEIDDTFEKLQEYKRRIQGML